MTGEKILLKLNLLYQMLEEELLPIFKEPFEINSLSLNTSSMKFFQDLFPNLSIDELRKILYLFKLIMEKSQENLHKVEIVSSGIEDKNLHVRETIGVIRQLFFEASHHILITGYAISSYFQQLADLLIEKGKEGINIEIYIENNQNSNLRNLECYLNEKNIKIYKFNNPSNKSSLHAKTIVVDYQKALITSANMSYNGMINNIEIGALIEGKQVKKIIQIIEKMKKDSLFELIN